MGGVLAGIDWYQGREAIAILEGRYSCVLSIRKRWLFER